MRLKFFEKESSVIRSSIRTTYCVMAMGGLAMGLGGCGLGSDCGGIAAIQCEEGFYCHYEEGICGSGDQSGTCQVIPESCTLEFAPVCGCDGTTYGNACSAAAAGVSVDSVGVCGGGDDSNNTDDGIGDFCGGIAGVACAEGQYCQFELGTCGAADQSGTCQNVPTFCTEEFAPVCGCDDTTYSNACFAAVASVSVLSPGPCP